LRKKDWLPFRPFQGSETLKKIHCSTKQRDFKIIFSWIAFATAQTI